MKKTFLKFLTVICKLQTAFCILLSAYCLLPTAYCQYPPQAGVAGSTAIHKTSSQFVSWAIHCDLKRGLVDITDASQGYTSSGDSSMAEGMADNLLVSMGDSGVATLYFAQPIINEAGFDFAVFENGFPNPANPEEAFLELAFVEVSSDGIQFFRFPASSNTQTDTQIAGSGMYMNARKINNLAGKYIGNYGTPFDLEELSGITGLDVNHITHVRIVDVIGDIGEHACFDKDNQVINDPFPTPFFTGGFDLDAVGVIHQSGTSVPGLYRKTIFSIAPNPATDQVCIKTSDDKQKQFKLELKDVTGKRLEQYFFRSMITIPVAGFSAGMYFITVTDESGLQWTERLFKY